MLLDDEEEEDLKANQSRFLKTGRGRRPKAAKPNEDTTMMIDTSSKKKISPVKPTGTTTQTIKSSDLAKNNSSNNKKGGSNDKIFSTLKEGVQNIFATTKQSRTDFVNQNMEGNNSEDDDEYEEDEDLLETEDLKAKRRLLELLNRGDDDEDQGVAIEYNSGEEGEGDRKKNVASSGISGKKNGINEDMDEDEEDDIMGDDY